MRLLNFRILGLILIALLSGCVIGQPDRVKRSGIERKELVAIGLVKDGLGLAAAGRLVEAEASIRQAQYLFPKAENIELNLAIILERQARYTEATAILRSMLKKHPDSAGYSKALARVLYASGRAPESVAIYTELFERGLKSDPGLAADAATSLSLIHFARGDEQEALCYSQYLVFFRKDAGSFSRHLRLLNGLGRSQMAIDAVSVITADIGLRQDPWVLTQVAAARIGSGDLTGASDIVSALIDRAPDDPDLKLSIGIMSSLLKLDRKGQEGATETETEVVVDPRIQDPVSLSRLALYWPAQLEEFAFAQMANLEAESSSPSSEPSWIERQVEELRGLVTD